MPNGDPFDPESLKITDQVGVGSAQSKRLPKEAKPKRSYFLAGPIPWPWLCRAMGLPGRAVCLGLVLWYLRGRYQSPVVTLSLSNEEQNRMDRQAARRAIGELEVAGLVSVARSPGHGLEVTIRDVE